MRKSYTLIALLLTFSSFAQVQLGSDIDGEAAGDQSGSTVSLSSDGTILAIGASFNDGTGTDAGHVRVYENSNGSWSQLGADIDGEAAGDWSGYSVSLSSNGTILAIGALSNSSTGKASAGHVRVYEYTSGSWSQLGADIDGEASGDGLGSSVSMSADGTIVAIGASDNDGTATNAGHVRIYEYSSGSWSQLGADIDGEAGYDASGFAVSLSSDGTIVAIGAHGNDDNGTDAGHVRVYEYSSGSWSQLGADIDGEAAGDFSGYSKSISLSSDGTILAIGAMNNGLLSAGHVRIYKYSSGSWSQLGADIDGEANGDYSGVGVSLSSDGTIVAIGAYSNGGTATLAGHVRIYEYSSGSWSQFGADIDGEAAGDMSGWAVSLSSNATNVAIGAVGNDANGTQSGHVRVYSIPICQDTIQQQPQSNTFYTVPGDAYFAVTHSDTAATFQWQQNSGTGWSNLSNLGIYSGTTTDSVVLTGITAALNNYGFRCLVNSCNMDTTDLATLTVVVTCQDTIQQQPQSNTFYTVPGDAYFAVTHSDAAATFQWQQNSGTGWSNLSNLGIYSGTTTDSVVLTGITAALNNYNFRCLVNSCNMDTTDLATLTVVVTCQDTIQQQPQSNTFYTVPGDAYFAVTHSDAAATFQWQQNTGTGWSNLSNLGVYSGTTTDSVVLTGITAALNNYGFRCLVNSCNMDTTDLATLTVVDNIGVNEVVKDIIISPNPTYGMLNIVLSASAEYEVFNINGQRVAQGKTEGQIDITNLPTGTYQLIINNDDGRSTHTIQKI